MIGKYDYDYYKERVTIPQVLTDLGYKWNRSAGRTTLEFVLHDRAGQVVDKLLVFHPNQKYATVSHRNEKGVDLINFIKQNLHRFPQSAGARNDVDGVNRVLAYYAKVEHDAGFHVADAMAKINGTLDPKSAEQYVVWDQNEFVEKQVFELDRYERLPGDVERAMGFLAKRGISRDTAELFRHTFEMVRDLRNDKYKFRNLSFPYTKAGTAHDPEQPGNIVGYEMRGYGKFKGKASGTDSKYGCWQAYLGSDKMLAISPFAITQIHFAESALDIMAYVQLNRAKLDLDHTLFVSVGGTPSVEQLKGVLKAWSIALPVLHFDNDENGVGYDCLMAAVIAGKSFSIAHNRDKDNPRINFTLGEKAFTVDARNFTYDAFREASGLRTVSMRIEKAPSQFKDWNDILISQMDATANMDRKVTNARLHRQYTQQAQAQQAAPSGESSGVDSPEPEDSPNRGLKI